MSEPTKKPTSHADKSGDSAARGDGAAGSESAYLADQAAQARAAIGKVLGELGGNVGRIADPRRLTRKHPWPAVGGAAVAGFAGALVAIPSREDRERKKAAEWVRMTQCPCDGDGQTPPKEKKPAKERSFLFGLLKSLFKVLEPAMLSAVSAGITAKMSNDEATPNPSQ